VHLLVFHAYINEMHGSRSKAFITYLQICFIHIKAFRNVARIRVGKAKHRAVNMVTAIHQRCRHKDPQQHQQINSLLYCWMLWQP
jgi:hypothetical protein